MTTAERPLPEHVAEDAGRTLAGDLAGMSLDALWALREQNDVEIKGLRDYKTMLDAELDKRFRHNHPDFDAETGGTVELTGAEIVVKLSYDRDYAWNEDVLTEVMMAKGEGGMPLLTEAERESLIKIEYTGKSRGYTALLKRGGVIADLLGQARFLKGSRPKFEATVRQ